WVATEGGKETAASFEVVAGGTAVLQRAGFVAIYYVDGDSVMATIFPDEGNQPRFRAHAVVEPKGKPAVLEFRLVDVTNLGFDAGMVAAGWEAIARGEQAPVLPLLHYSAGQCVSTWWKEVTPLTGCGTEPNRYRELAMVGAGTVVLDLQTSRPRFLPPGEEFW